MTANLISFIVALGATTLGSLTGLGGGVIIKPSLDALTKLDALSISMISAITVFAMASISLYGHIRAKTKLKTPITLPLLGGALVGGLCGSVFLDTLAEIYANNTIVIIQNVSLAGLVAVVFIYMLMRERLPQYNIKHWLVALLAGAAMGFSSSFLGIGGGPLNVSLLIFLFSYEAKPAVATSIVVIWIAQLSKILSGAFAGGFGFAEFNFTILPYVLAGGLGGGFLGRYLSGFLDNNKTEKLFNATQVLVFVICIWNILKLS